MDVTELENSQKELRAKEQISKELAEKCEVFYNFFETCPCNMAILWNDTADIDFKTTIVVSCNPASAKTYGKIDFSFDLLLSNLNSVSPKCRI